MPEDKDEIPLSQLIAERGIKTSSDLVDFMGGLLADVVAKRVDSGAAMAACTVSAGLLQVAEFQIRNAPMNGDGRMLRLGGGKP